MNYHISPSLLAADFSDLQHEISKIENTRADMLHLDVMDGVFVPNISFGPSVIEAIRKHSGLIFDVHLMITEPHKYIRQFAEAGADIITFHVESNTDIKETIKLIKSYGKKASLSLSPDTPANAVLPYLGDIDMVLCMTVYPGFGGQKFIPEIMPKVKRLRDYANANNIDIDIEVDGGLGVGNVADAYKAGANVIVAGSSVFHADDPAEVIDTMLSLSK